MKIVALAFATYHSGMAAVSVDSEAPALRKVALFHSAREYLQVIPVAERIRFDYPRVSYQMASLSVPAMTKLP
jgi:hypothetical protein